MTEARRNEIRRTYRLWRVHADLSQVEVEKRCREIYPEFPHKRFSRIEIGLDFPTPTQAKAIAEVLGVSVDDLPKPDDDSDDAEASRQPAGAHA